MTSILKVDTIQNSTGTDALSIDSSGNLDCAGSVHIKGLDYTPFASVQFTHNGNYVSKTADAPLDFDVALTNDGDHYDTSTYKFTCPVDGIYQWECTLLTSSASSQFGIQFHKNSTTIARCYLTYRSGHGSMTEKCSAGDEIWISLDTTLSVYEGSTTDSRYSWATYRLVG
jgi:hypothetical protein